MRANRAGTALCAAIASTARAVGMIVVWADAAAEVRTQRMSSLPQVLPSTREAIAPSTSVLLLARKAGPAKARAAMLTTENTATSSTVDRTAARPGVREASLVSSLTLTAQSQPQSMKTA